MFSQFWFLARRRLRSDIRLHILQILDESEIFTSSRYYTISLRLSLISVALVCRLRLLQLVPTTNTEEMSEHTVPSGSRHTL
jgi:hypothetical protein